MEQMTPLKRSQQFMRRVQEIILRHHGGEITVMSPVDARVLQIYSRIGSLFKGASILVEARLAEEAMILGRTMFTDSLYLMELAKRESERAALILGLWNESLTEWKHLEEEAQSLGQSNERDSARVLDFVAQGRKDIEAYRLRHGIGRLKSFPQERQLARVHGRDGELLDFAFAHRMVHRADIAQLGRTDKVGDVVIISLENPDDDSRVAASAFGMRSALYAHKAVASIFAWTETEPEEIDGLLAEIDHLLPEEGGSPGGER